MKLKYCKIKCTTPYSNIFGTVIQLIIRMRKLVEGQYNFLKNYPKSENQFIIAAIIDAYEQFKDKKEYINIDPFIHSVKGDINLGEKNIKFKDFFSSILWSIDFSNISEIRSCRQICHTSLCNLINEKEDESYIFEISLENNKFLSSLIQNQYKFSSSVIYKPDFLFFSPKQNNNRAVYNNITIDFDINLSNTRYTLSVIVLKKINSNHFVLFISNSTWIQFSDEDIKEISNKELLNKIQNQSEYQIELFGFSQNTSNNIINSTDSEPTIFKELDYSALENEQLNKNKVTPTENHWVTQHNNNFKQNIEYTVTFKSFKHESLEYQDVKIQKFENALKRNEILEDHEKDALSNAYILFFECNGIINTKNIFDMRGKDMTVYFVCESEIRRFELFHTQNLVEIEFYPNNASKENDVPSFISQFKPTHKCSEIFNFCAKKFKNMPFRLLQKIDLKGISYDRELANGNITTIKDLISTKSPTKIYYDLYGSTQRTPRQNTRQNISQTTKNVKYETDEKKFSRICKELNNTSVNKAQADKKENKGIFNKSQISRNNDNSLIDLSTDDESYENTENLLNPVFNNEKSGEKLVITRCLRSNLFINDSCVKRIVINNKSQIKGNIYDLLCIIMKAMKAKMLVYYIDKKNNFEITYYMNDFMVRDLHDSLNVQVKPHKGFPWRICVIFDKTKIDISNFDPNRDSCPFAIRYEPIKDLGYFKNLIMTFLFKYLENFDEIKRNKCFIPNIYTFDGTFKEINDVKDLKNSDVKPIFVTWRSPEVLNFVDELVKDSIQNDTDIVEKIMHS